MLITFDPPLGADSHVAFPSLLPRTQTIPLLFTAQLNASDHAQLLRDGARVQLWSNIPRDDPTDGSWRESEFVNACESSARAPDSSAYTRVSLRTSPPPADDSARDKQLNLVVALPPTTAATRRFSFTYRVVHPSGETTWLGSFGRDGSIEIEEQELSNDSSLFLLGEWSADRSSGVKILHNETETDVVQVAKVQNLSDLRIWALGKDKFISNLENASILVFIPRSQRSLAVSPSYVMAASPGSTLTVSNTGCVTFSGAGTLQLRQNDVFRSPGPFIEDVLRYSKLNNWNVVASNAHNDATVLVCTGCGYPIPAAAISFGPLQASVSADFGKLVRVFTDNDVQEFAIFSSRKTRMHIFNLQQPEVQNLEKVLLELDPTGAEFTLSPIYRLQTNNASNKVPRSWSAAILTHYKVVPAPLMPTTFKTLPTPPPSPPPHPIAKDLSRLASSSSLNARLTSMSSSPSISSTLPGVGYQIRQRVKQHDNRNQMSPKHAQQNQQLSDTDNGALFFGLVRLPRRPSGCFGLTWIFKCIFASVRALFKFVFRLVWRPSSPALVRSSSSTEVALDDLRSKSDDTPSAVIIADEEMTIKEKFKQGGNNAGERDMDQVQPHSSSPGRVMAAAIIVEEVDAVGVDDSASEADVFLSESSTLQEIEIVGLVPNEPKIINVTSPSHQSDTGEDIFHAEVSPLWYSGKPSGDDSTASKTAMVEIVLIPLANIAGFNLNQIGNAGSDSGDDPRHYATDPSQLGEKLERAICFLDGSNVVPDAISSVEVGVVNERSKQSDKKAQDSADLDEDGYATSGYILRYLVTWEDLTEGKTVSIRTPSFK